MTRSREPVPFPEDPRDPDEGGGWSDFLSESSEELQGLAGAPSPLDSRAPEPTEETPALTLAEGAAAPAAAIDSVQTITLDEIVARQVPVQWSDAVAIVEELCQELLDGPGPVGIPEAGEVSITSEGRVAVSRGSRRSGDISRLSVILQKLLPVSSTPLALRLFVTSSMSPDRYPSLERYAEALAHYAAPNPDRAVLIRDLCRRSLAFPAGLTPVVALGAGVERSQRPKAPVARTRARLWGAAAAAVLVVGAVAAVLMWPSKAVLTPVRASVSEPPPAPVPVPVPVPESTIAPEVERPAAAQPVLPARTEAPIVPVVRGRPVREVAIAPVPPPQPPPEAPTAAPDAPTLQALPLAPTPVPIARAPSAGDQLASRQPQETSAAREPARPPAPAFSPQPVATAGIVPEPRIFSRDDRDVEPPVALSLWPITPPGLVDRVTNTLELLIDERGRVQSAKWVWPSRLIDGVVPQYAKNMNFRPAVRNGTAVRYRLYVTLPTPPPPPSPR